MVSDESESDDVAGSGSENGSGCGSCGNSLPSRDKLQGGYTHQFRKKLLKKGKKESRLMVMKEIKEIGKERLRGPTWIK